MTAAERTEYEGIFETLLDPRVKRPEVRHGLEVHELLEQGLGGEAVKRLAHSYDLDSQVLAQVLGLRLRTLQRREQGQQLQPGETDRLWRAAVVLHEATDLLGSREKATHWFQSQNAALGGARPADLLGTEAGYAEVRNVLGRLEYGVWS